VYHPLILACFSCDACDACDAWLFMMLFLRKDIFPLGFYFGPTFGHFFADYVLWLG
jgi:hypothetical protein